jgi:hypothetical protein
MICCFCCFLTKSQNILNPVVLLAIKQIILDDKEYFKYIKREIRILRFVLMIFVLFCFVRFVNFNVDLQTDKKLSYLLDIENQINNNNR